VEIAIFKVWENSKEQISSQSASRLKTIGGDALIVL